MNTFLGKLTSAVERRRNWTRLVVSLILVSVLTVAAGVFAVGLENPTRVVALVAVGVVLVVLAFWKLPQWQAEAAQRHGSEKSAFELENDARGTMADALGGLFLVVGLAATWLQLEDGREEQRRTAASLATQQALTREGQITDRFTSAIAQLGSEEMTVQLGGIYALEGIAADSPEDYHDSVMQVLTSFVRTRASLRGEGADLAEMSTLIRVDQPAIQAAMTVIGRRDASHDRPGVCRYYLVAVFLGGIDLRGANLTGTCMHYSDLSGAWLQDADLRGAQINCTVLDQANLEGADLEGAIVTPMYLDDAVGVSPNYREETIAVEDCPADPRDPQIPVTR